MPLHLNGAVACGGQSIGCAEVCGFFEAVRGVAFKFKSDSPAAARGLAFCVGAERVAAIVPHIVAVVAHADTTFMDVCHGLGRRVRLDAVAAHTRAVKNRDWLAAHFAADARAGFCRFEGGIADGLDFYCFVLLHDSLPFNVSAMGPYPVNFLFTGIIIAACKSNFNRQKYQTYYNKKKFFCASFTTVWYDSSSKEV